jgi:PKD repeat protein
MDINFLGGSYSGRSIADDNQETVNWYPEIGEDPAGSEEKKLILYPTPGLNLFTDLKDATMIPKPPPTPSRILADFTIAETAYPWILQFTNTSPAGATTFFWEFGDDQHTETSTDENPLHDYWDWLGAHCTGTVSIKLTINKGTATEDGKTHTWEFT